MSDKRHFIKALERKIQEREAQERDPNSDESNLAQEALDRLFFRIVEYNDAFGLQKIFSLPEKPNWALPNEIEYGESNRLCPKNSNSFGRHEWKKTQGFMANSFYEDCEYCGVKKEDCE